MAHTLSSNPIAGVAITASRSGALDAIFTFDMCLQFFVAFEQETRVGAGKKYVDDQRLVIQNYLRTGFTLDAVTIVVPLSFDLYLAHGVSSDDDEAGSMSVLKLMRVFRLTKLIRLLRASSNCHTHAPHIRPHTPHTRHRRSTQPFVTTFSRALTLYPHAICTLTQPTHIPVIHPCDIALRHAQPCNTAVLR